MRLLKLAVLVCAVAVAYHYWRKHHPPDADAYAAVPSSANKNGFVELAPNNNAPLGLVLIVAPPDCPSDEARRADELQELLAAEGIPSRRTETLGFAFEGTEDVDQFNLIMTGKMPVVFVNGRAKNDPRVAEIVAEYYEQGRAPVANE